MMKTPCCSTTLDFTGLQPTVGAIIAAAAIYAATGILVIAILLNAVRP